MSGPYYALECVSGSAWQALAQLYCNVLGGDGTDERCEFSASKSSLSVPRRGDDLGA